MGTTLQNGVYLPNEGERNCYAGLKTNWEILDQKVADITALQQAVAGALHREIVASLPTTDIDPNTIYMILSGTSATENVYNEFMYVNNAWELIGTSATDLTNYYTKGEVDGLLLLKANASDLTSHTGDTTIHVTASDKTKWTNSANTHVLRLALSALTPSTSDNSFSNLDDSTALKVGDKVMDTAGVLFEVTAIDTQNSTFTIGTALVDLAQDSDVVHKSGNETVGGQKTFSSDITLQGTTTPVIKTISNFVQDTSAYNGSVSWVIRDKDNLNNILESALYKYSAKSIDWQLKLTGIDNGVSNTKGIRFTLDPVNDVANFIPIGNNNTSLGNSSTRWKDVYATNYYYGSNNVEFSTKFVTTDTNQTITGQKVFDDINTMSSASEIGVSGGNRSYKVLDKNKKTISSLEGGTFSSGMAYSYWLVNNGTDVFNGVTLYQPSANLAQLRPYNSTLSMQLGASNRYFSDCYTSKINGVEPSSLSLPSGNVSDVIDISSYLVNLDGTTNTYTAPANGWISITLSNCSGIQAYISGLWGHQVIRPSAGVIRFLMPVLKNQTVAIWIWGGTVDNAKFIPCQGNI